jgi:ketosteroid isomerase-like protein
MPHEPGHPANRVSDQNADVIRRSMDAWNAGDMETAAGLIADDIEWHEIGRSEAVHGKAALAERFNQPDAQSWEITGENHDIVANDEHVVSLVTATAKRGDGQTLTYKVAEIYHVKDGKITQRWAFSDDTEAITRFFGGS